jgi:acyl transferase domain-containing protein/surfactin synthase thioesterase subunit
MPHANGSQRPTVRRRRSEPLDIAIIGMACRFPGAATPEAFWSNLVRGVESITFFSDDELRVAGVPADVLRHPHYVKAAPILESPAGFDAAFFDYSPAEARLMDPQHRLFLEVAWETFEDAGYDPLGDKGVVGVYAGAGGLVSSYVLHHDHPELRGQTGDLGHIANDRDFLCSRVSFKLNLTGPSLNVQTACSTSLVAVHLACRSLRDGEADMALAGASVVRVPHIRGYIAEAGGIYSPDGHCRAFDAKGSGTLFGSGVAAVLLKPLAAALADEDRIYAIVKSSAIDNDGGMKLNYTASTVEAQTRAMAAALSQAAIAPDTLGYVECHGTATVLGDPLEIQALTRAFRAHTNRVGFCPIGSVKSNVGHLEQCAGLAGLLKATLALHHRAIPPSLHFDTPNPRIPFERSPFFVNTALRPFRRDGAPRRAAVNSIGMGGTNAFVVIEEAPPAKLMGSQRPFGLLSLSAKTGEALTAQVANVRRALAAENGPDLRDACLTANRGRHHFGHRFTALGRDRFEVLAELDRFLAGDRSHVARGVKRRREPVVFLFSGQGSQHVRMGEALYRSERVVRDTLERCFALFESAGIDLREALFSDDETRLTRTLYAQPALFAVQMVLTDLWTAWGITADTVIGHSVGEFAAAVTAGVLSLEDAARLVAARARLMNDLPGGGGMVAVAARPDAVRSLFPMNRHDLAIAAENAPESTVVSGPKVALRSFVARCRAAEIPVTELKVSHAFHSPLMEPILDGVEAVARTVAFKPPRIRWISTLTGDEITEAPLPRYWSDQLRGTVRFRAAVGAAAAPGAIALEIGPGTTLITLGRRCVTQDMTWIPSLAARGDDWSSVLDAVRGLYLKGCSLRWNAFESDGGRRISLPTYPFEHRDYWLESRALEPPAPTVAATPRGAGSHPILGERLGDGVRFESVLTRERCSFLGDHRLFQRAVLPTTAILDAVTAAAHTALSITRAGISDFVYERPLVVPDDGAVVIQVTLEPQTERIGFRVESTGVDSDAPWLLHATGVLDNDWVAGEFPPFPSPAARAASLAVPTSAFYHFLDAHGLSYGPAFRGIASLWRGDDHALARVALPAGLASDAYRVHPAFLDACLHLYSAVIRKYGTFGGPAGDGERRIYVPIAVESFQLYRSAVTRGWVHASVLERTGDDEARLKLDVRVWDDDGRPVAVFRGLTIRQTGESMFTPGEQHDLTRVLYAVKWREVARPSRSVALRRHWYVVSKPSRVAQRLADTLRTEGAARVVLVPPNASAVDRMIAAMPDDSVGVVYLGALSAPSLRATNSSATPVTETLVCGGPVDLVKALDRARGRLSTPPRLWLVTRGSQAADGAAPIEIVQSPVWGLGRTLALEYPDLWGGLMDLPADADDTACAKLLVQELKAESPDDQVVLRAGARFAPRVTRLEADVVPSRSVALVDNATYWIVGGLGRIGLKVAAALVAAGARHLVLTGRRAAERDATAALEALRGSAEVVVMASDVTRAADVQAILRRIERSMPPLKGVIHAAAVFDDAVVANVRDEQLRAVLAPKVAGAWLLHRETRKLALDFFVLFSSVLSIWGGTGQAAYTAANSFLDALAIFRRSRGLPATVLNWGPWADASLAARWGTSGMMLWKQRGTTPLAADTCLSILLRFLGAGPAQVLVSETRWGQFLAQFRDVPPLYREVADGVERRPDISEPGGARGSVIETVRRQTSRVLGLVSLVDVDQPLNELGLDSLLAVSLANRLRQALNVTVPTAMLLKGSSVRALVTQLFPDATLPQQAPPAPENGAAGRGWATVVAGRGWLVFPRPNAEARMRLFCFPFAGGGAATFRPWADRLDPSIEVVAIEPPGRQTRIDEAPIRDMETFVGDLVPELLPFLDKPFAVYGHCLGALTLFETVRELHRQDREAPVHIFVSGARTPDELHRQQNFELTLLVRLCGLPNYDIFTPVHRQSDDVFAEVLREFKVLATESLLSDPELRRLILPVIRAEFEMSSNYRYTPDVTLDAPITCLTGLRDTYVTADNAAAWGRFTTGRFELITVETDHFLVVDDDELLIDVVNRELTRHYSTAPA